LNFADTKPLHVMDIVTCNGRRKSPNCHPIVKNRRPNLFKTDAPTAGRKKKAAASKKEMMHAERTIKTRKCVVTKVATEMAMVLQGSSGQCQVLTTTVASRPFS
jgi:hypothetical protein